MASNPVPVSPSEKTERPEGLAFDVEDGADVSEGQPIYVLESEKTTQDIEAPATGKLAHKVQSGEIYPVGTEIGEIG